MLKAGVSIIDISPKPGVELAGYPHCPRPNTGVHDPLYASCLYLDNGIDHIVIVTLDLLYFGKKYVKELRKKTRKNILFSSTHTHSGPWASSVLASELAEGITENEEYIKELLEKLEQCINEATTNTFEAKAGSFVGRCGAEQGVGGNRREKGGVCDPSVNVLAIKDSKGQVRACLVNYALHPTFLHAESTVVSADYPGYIRRFLSFAYPNAVTLFALGAAGNQSSRYHRVGQEFEEAARVGTTIGVEVRNCIEKMEYFDNIDISAKSEEVQLPLRHFPSIEEAEKQLEIAQKTFEQTRNSDYITARNAELALFGAENILSYAKLNAQGYKSDELPCEIMLAAIGDTVIAAVQGELFVEFALEIKAMRPNKKTFVFTTSNGSLPGYVYTRQAGIEGGYEVGTSMLDNSAGEVIINKIREMI